MHFFSEKKNKGEVGEGPGASPLDPPLSSKQAAGQSAMCQDKFIEGKFELECKELSTKSIWHVKSK